MIFDVREVYPPQLTKVPTHVMASAALASAAHAAVRSRVASRCDRSLSPSPLAPPPPARAVDSPRRVRVDVSHHEISRLTSRAPLRHTPHGRSGRALSRASVRARAGSPTASISTSPLSDTPADAPSDPLAALQGALVHHAPTGDLVDLGARLSETSPGKVTVVAFMRSFG